MDMFIKESTLLLFPAAIKRMFNVCSSILKEKWNLQRKEMKIFKGLWELKNKEGL